MSSISLPTSPYARYPMRPGGTSWYPSTPTWRPRSARPGRRAWSRVCGSREACGRRRARDGDPCADTRRRAGAEEGRRWQIAELNGAGITSILEWLTAVMGDEADEIAGVAERVGAEAIVVAARPVAGQGRGARQHGAEAPARGEASDHRGTAVRVTPLSA